MGGKGRVEPPDDQRFRRVVGLCDEIELALGVGTDADNETVGEPRARFAGDIHRCARVIARRHSTLSNGNRLVNVKGASGTGCSNRHTASTSSGTLETFSACFCITVSSRLASCGSSALASVM